MPLTCLEVCRPYPPATVAALMEALYLAQREALNVPAHDRQIRYIEHRPEHFAIPPDKTDAYTLVQITLFAGRTLATKRALYQAIVQRLSALGIPADHVFIVLNEQPLDNWGMRGGIPASEMDLGFTVAR